MSDKNWSQTYTGRRFDYDKIDSHDYSLDDIAHHLSLICRFGGASLYHYSVGYHSLLVTQAIYRDTGNPILALDGLFHDAEEAYMGDMRTMLKPRNPDFKRRASAVDLAIRRHFRSLGVPEMEDPLTKEYDRRILLDERAQVMRKTNDPWAWTEGLDPLGVIIEVKRPAQVRDTWLRAVDTFSKLALRKKEADSSGVVEFPKSRRVKTTRIV